MQVCVFIPVVLVYVTSFIFIRNYSDLFLPSELKLIIITLVHVFYYILYYVFWSHLDIVGYI
jgi:hypothetical protein